MAKRYITGSPRGNLAKYSGVGAHTYYPKASKRRSDQDAAIVDISSFHGIFSNTSGLMKGVLIGIGDLTNTGADARNTIDYDGRVVPIQPVEPTWKGGRHAINLSESTDDFSSGLWSKSANTFTPDANTILFGSDGSEIYQLWDDAIDAGRSFIAAVDLSGSGTIGIRLSTVGGTYEESEETVTLSTTSRRYRVAIAMVNSSHTALEFSIRRRTGDTDSVSANRIKVEESTWFVNPTIPSEYTANGTPIGAEIYDTANALQGDTDATTGLGYSLLVGGGNMFESQSLVTPGTPYAIHAQCNGNPSGGARFYQDLTASFDLISGKKYRLVASVRHDGTGGEWYVGIGASNSLATAPLLCQVSSTDTEFVEYSLNFVYSVSMDYLVAREINATNDGGIYMGAVSIKEATTGYSVYDTYNGNTVDGNVVTDAVGAKIVSPDLPPYLHQAISETNNQVYSNNQTTSAWLRTRILITKNQVGRDNQPGAACLLKTNNAGTENTSYVYSAHTLGSDGLCVVLIDCKSDQSDWIRVSSTGYDATQLTYFDINNAVVGVSDSSDAAEIVNLGKGWVRCLFQFSTTTDLDGGVVVSLAEGDDDRLMLLDGSHSIIIDNVMVLYNTTIPQVRDLSPIYTEGSVVSTIADAYSFDISNIDIDEVCLVLEWIPSYSSSEVDTQEIILSTLASRNRSLINDRVASGVISTFDGTSSSSSSGLTWAANDVITIGLYASLSSNEKGLCINGAWVGATAYDGYAVDAALRILDSLVGMGMRDFRIYDATGSADQIAIIDRQMAL